MTKELFDQLTELSIPENMHIPDSHGDDSDRHDREERHGGHDEKEPERERQPTERDRMMAEIAKRREEVINRELRFGEDLADEAREASGLERRSHEDERHQEQEATEPSLEDQVKEAIKNPPVQDQRLRTVELDGQVYQVTEAQFEELARLGARTNVAMSRQQAQHQPQPQQQAAPQQPQQPQVQRRILSKEDSEAVADRLLYGGRDQVAQTVEALAQHIASQSQQERVNQEAIVAEAARRALEHTQLNSDLQQISGEYPTLWQDRILGELAAVQLSHVRQEDQALGRTRTNLDSYREACNRVLDALGQPRPGVSAKQAPATQAAVTTRATNDRNAVLERKRVARNEPQALDRRAESSATMRPESGHDIVAKMRKARHQAAFT